jgi:hypothetical protein
VCSTYSSSTALTMPMTINDRTIHVSLETDLIKNANIRHINVNIMTGVMAFHIPIEPFTNHK